MPAGSAAEVDAWLAQLPPEPRRALEKVRGQMRRAAPKAQEGMGYGLPGFYQDGPILYYGAAKKHLAIYGTIPAEFDDELAGFARSKGTIKFTPDKPVPAALLARIVKAKVKENTARADKRVRRRA